MLDLIDLERPTSLNKLFKARKKVRGATVLLAGGTDLLVYAKDGKVPPATWFDITDIDELKNVEVSKGSLRIGALVTWKQGDEAPDIARNAAALRDSAYVFASPPIRGLGTFAGNIANASPAGDSLPPFYALDAVVVMKNADRTRILPIEKFIKGVRKIALEKDEVITEIRVPIVRGRRSVFLKLGPRQALAISKLSVAVSGTFKRGAFRDLRVALGAVAPTVVRVRAAEDLLEGSTLGDADIDRAVALSREAASPITDVRSTAAYRRAVVGDVVRRALERLRDGAPGGDAVLAGEPPTAGKLPVLQPEA